MFTLNVVTPEKVLAHRVEVEEVIVPGFRGELNLLPGHAPIMTTLSEGVLRYRLKGESKQIKAAISWGYCEVSPSGIDILAETAEFPEQIDFARVEESLKKVEKELDHISDLDPELIEKYQRKAKRARVRLSLKDK
ncbi:MAG: ATP synthase F1 subunit epsilon [Bdellovibrionales bacterium]|nr:ATP synthase F1 subunit epsilon [Bdellovibrionales bacterium]